MGGSSLGGSEVTPTKVASSILGNSWSTLQGLASTVLGNDVEMGTEGHNKRATGRPRRTKPSLAQHRRAVSAVPPQKWGPSGGSGAMIGIGFSESREATVQAKKRERLLLANGYETSDSSGNYKRRMSDDRTSSAPPVENEREGTREAMVYIYQVQPQDTLAGVTIKFGCHPTVFRRVNRLWPNDTIQSRKTVMVPVDTCSVKGGPCPSPTEDALDLLSDETTPTASDEPFTTWPPPQTHIRTSSSITRDSSSSNSDPPWRHDSWVLLPTHPTPIELARLSRRTLGFFPPGRRKSNSYSEFDVTPSTSLDLVRPSSPAASSSVAPSLARKSSHGKGSNGNSIAAHMIGPGGVGTLDPSARNPGPAPNKLNEYLGPYLPDVTPKPGFETEDPLPALTAAAVPMSNSIEGWVRKIASRAASALPPAPSQGKRGKKPRHALGGAVVGLEGDLIELSDGLEGLDIDENRGRKPSAGATPSETEASKGWPVATHSLGNGVRGRAIGSSKRSD